MANIGQFFGYYLANIGQILIKYKAHIWHCLVLRPADLDDASNVNCTVMFQNISVVYHAYQTFTTSAGDAYASKNRIENMKDRWS